MNVKEAKEIKETTAEEANYVGGYKLIEITVSDSAENLYAVVTPVKNK
ncbi:hypothetical protein [Bacillus taeanensis]|nr:hypothetical protein [Bacillus taeanensis]